MRHTLALIACAAAAAVAAPALAADRAFPVPGFDKLRVDGPYTVRVRTGAHVSVNAHGPQRKLERLQVEARDGTLVISTEKSAFNMGWGIGENQEVVIDVTVPMLSSVALNGSGDVNIDRIKAPAFETILVGSGDLAVARLDTDRLNATVTGSGDLSLTGHAERADASVRGSGDLKAAGLTVGLLNANVNGSGDLTVGPTRQADGSVSGSGDITVGGQPRCNISKHGSGDVRCGG